MSRPYLPLLVALLVLAFAGSVAAADPRPVEGKNGMVAAAEPLAAAIGVEILQQGGNAVDAAVAVGFALAVTYPAAGNLGGGGFLVALIGGEDGPEAVALDFRETAPAASHARMYLDAKEAGRITLCLYIQAISWIASFDFRC